MNRAAVAFLTKDKTELTKLTFVALTADVPDFDLLWIDGSAEQEGKVFAEHACFEDGRAVFHSGVRGGADAAIVYALTAMLNYEHTGPGGSQVGGYEYVGLCENDVLLPPNWFEDTMRLFEQGRQEGLNVGAVSPRCYEDRILIQRDGYAIMHNLGAGIVIFSREAARIILDNYRTTWSTDNRNIFCQLSGIDIGPTWAFRATPQWLTADWGFDAVLAKHGLASLALTPSHVEMIGQHPALADQGLTIASQPVEHLSAEGGFNIYRHSLASLWEGTSNITVSNAIHQDVLGNFTIFPHQIHKLGGSYGNGASAESGWKLQWTQGFGPFSWRASAVGDSLIVSLSGHVEFLVSGGPTGAQVEVIDYHSGFTCNPVLAPEGSSTQIMAIAVPASVSYREVRLTALTPGAVFYGIRTREPQMLYHGTRFDHSFLPAAGG